jgi:CHRD domain-containing protein
MSKSSTTSKICSYTLILSIIMIVSVVPVLTYAQQQTNFVANLSGKNVVPPVSTPATGIAKFHTNSNGTLSYEIDVMNLNKVIAGHIGTKNGTEILQLLNPYATISTGFNQVKSLYPTEVVNGRLASGVITTDDLLGPFFGKSVTDLVNAMKHGDIYVTIRTQPNQQGEIAGQIVPSK